MSSRQIFTLYFVRPNGLKEREAEDIISKFMQNRKICCFEITEVNPTLDKENLMSKIAFKHFTTQRKYFADELNNLENVEI